MPTAVTPNIRQSRPVFFAAELLPFVGFFETFTGQDLQGEELGVWRWLGLLDIVPAVGKLRLLLKGPGDEILSALADGTRATKGPIPGPGTPHVGDLPGAQSLFDLPKSAMIIDDFDEIARGLDVNHGIPRTLAGERLHEIKSAAGLGGADNVVFGPTGDVWDPVTGEWLGSLTTGGAP